MAKTIAKCFGYDKSRCKESTRLGDYRAEGQANTYRTFTTCVVNANGSGMVSVIRDDKLIHKYEFGPE